MEYFILRGGAKKRAGHLPYRPTTRAGLALPDSRASGRLSTPKTQTRGGQHASDPIQGVRNVRTVLLALILALLLSAVAVAQTLYNSPSVAHQHCPHDNVVWLNTATGIYHFDGERWYGRTKHGAFVCQREANAAGDRPTRNGQ